MGTRTHLYDHRKGSRCDQSSRLISNIMRNIESGKGICIDEVSIISRSAIRLSLVIQNTLSSQQVKNLLYKYNTLNQPLSNSTKLGSGFVYDRILSTMVM